MTETMVNYVLPDIPRFYTAVAEWMACLICILEVKRRVQGWKLAGISVGVLLVPVCIFTGTGRSRGNLVADPVR